MRRDKKHFWAAVKRAAAARPENSALPKAGSALSPWAFWLLLALVQQRRRQRWVADVVKHRLQGEDISGQGIVPGMSDWEYRFHGRGCELTHRITGESIDVDFYDDQGEWFDGWFYLRYLRTAHHLTPPEQRLIELHPSVDTVMMSVAELKRTGFVTGNTENRNVFRLSDDVVANTAVIEAFCDAWNRGGNRFAAAVEVGDWLAASDQLPEGIGETTVRLLQAAAAECRRERARIVKQQLEEGQGGRTAVFALAELGPPDLDVVLEQVLQGPPGSKLIGAIDVIAQRGNSVWCDRVFALFRRLDPNAEIPEPAAWIRCAEFLLKQAFRMPDVLTALSRAHSHEAAEAALFLLEYAPQISRPQFRAALRSRIPYDRTRAAAVLAILDEEWGRREMIDVLRASEDQQMTCDCRSALCCSRSPEAHRAVEEWEERFPYAPERGPYYSATDVALHNCDSFLQYEMSQLHDRVLPLRGRVK